MNALLDAALAMHAAGLAVLPVRADGSKAPAVDWKKYQDGPAEAVVLNAWFSTGRYDGLGVVCGQASGHLEMVEIEGRAVHLIEPLGRLMGDHGLADLWVRLCNGYLEQTPSGGIHWHYRIAGEFCISCGPDAEAWLDGLVA